MTTSDSPAIKQAFDTLGGDYDPLLYRADRRDTPQPLPPIGEREEWLATYRETGYQVVRGLFPPEMVRAAMDGIDHLISGAVPDFKGVQWERAARGLAERSDLATRRDLVRKLIYYADHDERLHQMSHAPWILELTGTILGGEPYLFADQALLKPPGIGREKPWHQDKAYFDVRPGAPVVGIWIALDETDVDNGCMHLVRGSHQSGAVVHFNRRDFQLCDTDLAGTQVTATPMSPGDALVFDGMLWHGTPRNDSDRRRWALQFHYTRTVDMWQSKEQRRDYKAARLEAFGADGKDVTC